MFSEFVGLTQEVASFIEQRRESAIETKCDILKRLLVDPMAAIQEDPIKLLDLGQGVRLPVGERLYLYLSKPNSIDQRPDGIAEARDDGLYLDGEKVQSSHRSLIAPAMHIVQKKASHHNQAGKLISLSAYRQWHVIRDGRLVTLEKLKNPALRRTRTSKASKVNVEALLAELGIEI